MNTEFTIEQPGKIYLNEEVRNVMGLEGLDELYIHVEPACIVINKVFKDYYYVTGVDEDNCLYINSEILQYKLMKKPCETISVVIKPGSLIIPMTPEQMKAKLRYVRNVDEFGRVILHKYVRDKMGFQKGTHVRFIMRENHAVLIKDKNSRQVIEEFGFTKLPKELRKCKKIEFEIINNEIIFKPFIE